MNQSATEQKRARGTIDSNVANTRLTGSWLIIARTLWLVLVIPSIGLCVTSLIVYYQQMQTVCVDLTTCNNLPGALPPQMLQALLSIGISARGFAVMGSSST
jgi:hypothetical protein